MIIYEEGLISNNQIFGKPFSPVQKQESVDQTIQGLVCNVDSEQLDNISAGLGEILEEEQAQNRQVFSE